MVWLLCTRGGRSEKCSIVTAPRQSPGDSLDSQTLTCTNWLGCPFWHDCICSFSGVVHVRPGNRMLRTCYVWQTTFLEWFTHAKTLYISTTQSISGIWYYWSYDLGGKTRVLLWFLMHVTGLSRSAMTAFREFLPLYWIFQKTKLIYFSYLPGPSNWHSMSKTDLSTVATTFTVHSWSLTCHLPTYHKAPVSLEYHHR